MSPAPLRLSGFPLHHTPLKVTGTEMGLWSWHLTLRGHLPWSSLHKGCESITAMSCSFSWNLNGLMPGPRTLVFANRRSRIYVFYRGKGISPALRLPLEAQPLSPRFCGLMEIHLVRNLDTCPGSGFSPMTSEEVLHSERVQASGQRDSPLKSVCVSWACYRVPAANDPIFLRNSFFKNLKQWNRRN